MIKGKHSRPRRARQMTALPYLALPAWLSLLSHIACQTSP